MILVTNNNLRPVELRILGRSGSKVIAGARALIEFDFHEQMKFTCQKGNLEQYSHRCFLPQFLKHQGSR